jgi:molecular chaperone DnaJ
MATAALGGELEVPTLDGRVKLKIPAGTQSGRLFKLAGKGVKSVNTHAPGNLLCKVSVETPVNLTSEQRELLEKFRGTLEGKHAEHSPAHSGWLDSVKKFFGVDK